MRILIANHQFFPEFYTGTERFSLNLAHQLQKMGHCVEIVTYGMKDDTSKFQNKTGKVLWREYVYEGLKVTAIKHLNPNGKINISLFDSDVLAFFNKFLTQNAYDLIHVAHPMRIGAIVTAAKEKKIPIVFTLTDFWLLCPLATMVKKDSSLCTNPKEGVECGKKCFSGAMQDELSERFSDCVSMLKEVDRICAPSIFLAQMFKRVLPEIPITVLRHGIDYKQFHKKNDKKLVYRHDREIHFGFIGTILRHKGVDILIDAFRKVDKENLRLDIYGGYFHEKPYFDRLKKMSAKDDRIRFVGEYSHSEVHKILSKLDAVVVPSVWWENSPLTILTSLSHRVPVITSDIGGMREFVKNEINGYTFNMGDSKDLALIFNKIASNPQLLADMGNRIQLPPRIEEEAFQYEGLYSNVKTNIKNGPPVRINTQRAPQRMLPNFFIVGAAKSGTTSVYNYLRQHPEIYLSPIKEPNYFCKDINCSLFTDAYQKNVALDMEEYCSGPMKPIPVAHVDKWDHYVKLFSKVTKEKAIGEMSNAYLHSNLAAKEIYAKFPYAKIVMLLRNPIERAFSHFLMALNIGHDNMDQKSAEGMSFIEAVENDRALSLKAWGASNLYIELGLYYEQVKRYVELFPSQHIKVILYDDFKNSTHDVVQELFEFLRVHNEFFPDVSKKYNDAKYRRDMTLEEKNYITPFFQKDIEKLSTLIDRDLSMWIN